MTRIKYKIWDKQEKKWFEPTYRAYEGVVEDLYVSPAGEIMRRTYDKFEHESLFPDRYEIILCTGLKDRDGVEIYEGDIIRWHDIVTVDYVIGFTDGVFCLGESGNENLWHHREEISVKWQVIGNQFENPELLEETK